MVPHVDQVTRKVALLQGAGLGEELKGLSFAEEPVEEQYVLLISSSRGGVSRTILAAGYDVNIELGNLLTLTVVECLLALTGQEPFSGQCS